MFFSNRKLDINNKVVLITGAANGIGRSTAKLIKSKGGTPVCVDLASGALDSLSDELGENSLVASCDVTDSEGMNKIVNQTVEKFGGIDVVVANAGIEKVGPSWIMSPEEFESVLKVNIFGVYRTIKPAIAHVIKRKGHIVTTSSVSALVPWPLAAAYGASKAFVASWMRSLRVELSGTGATAGAVYFGYIDTSMMQRAQSKSIVREVYAKLPSFSIGLKPKTPEYAAGKIIKNIEQRSAMEFSHFEVRCSLLFQGIVHLFDDIFARQLDIGEAIKKYYP